MDAGNNPKSGDYEYTVTKYIGIFVTPCIAYVTFNSLQYRFISLASDSKQNRIENRTDGKKGCAFLLVSTLFLPDFSFNHSQKFYNMVKYMCKIRVITKY